MLEFYRGQSSCCSIIPTTSTIRLKTLRLQKIYIQAVSKKSASRDNSEDASNEESASIAPKKTRAPRRSRKKSNVEISEENSAEIIDSLEKEEKSTATTSDEGPKKVTRRGRRKGKPF